MIRCMIAVVCLLLLAAGSRAQTAVPREPVEIGSTPQLFVDQFIVESTWTIKYKAQHVQRVFHPALKHPANPLLKGGIGYANVAFDKDASVYHLWYQTHGEMRGKDEEKADYGMAYARSADGITWTKPVLGLHDFEGSKENNIVLKGKRKASSIFLLDVPEKDKRGYKFLLLYRDVDGTHIVGTHDGIHFEIDTPIQKLHSDTVNSIVYDAAGQQYVMYCRPKHIFRASSSDDMIDLGESRRIARITSPQLWTTWPSDPQTILLPDELDVKNRYHAFYGMPTQVYGGVFFGFLWLFRWNDLIHPELAWSRDGVSFERHPLRPRLIDYGKAGEWDDEMVFPSHWIEVGDEWRIYYAGWDGPHGNTNRNSGLGLATLRKEGFVSLRGPRDGGVVCTRIIRWPGGPLRVNAAVLKSEKAAAPGRLTARVSDEKRKVIPGFDHADCAPFTGDATAAEITWKGGRIADLKGRAIRLEFFLQDADLYSFRGGE